MKEDEIYFLVKQENHLSSKTRESFKLESCKLPFLLEKSFGIFKIVLT